MLYNFLIWFADKSSYEMDNVIKVEFIDILGDEISVSGDNLLTYKYPTTRELHFISENEAYTTAGKIIKSIKVTQKA